ncbi:unnamed protein product [Absidia cylindrospora]
MLGKVSHATINQPQFGASGQRYSKYSSTRQHRFRQQPLPTTSNDNSNHLHQQTSNNNNNNGVVWRQPTSLFQVPDALSSSASSTSPPPQSPRTPPPQSQSSQSSKPSILSTTTATGIIHEGPSMHNGFDDNTDGMKSKSKSQKLLCLWPLPVMTRYTILVSILISALNASHLIQLTCSSPKYVIFRHEIVSLLLSPFVFSFTLHGIVLFSWNIVILGLFEESLSQPLGGTHRFFSIVSSIVLTVCAIRQGLGFLFSRATGWAIPTLFFSDSIHECNQGLAPFLFALLIIQSASIGDKYILIFGDDKDSNYKLTIHKVTLQLSMLLVNYMVKNILWWSLTGLITGYLATIIIQTIYLTREDEGYYYLTHPSDDQEQGSTLTPLHATITQEKDRQPPLLSSWNGFLDPYRRTPLWRVLWSAIKRGSLVMAMTLLLLLTFNAYYTRENFVDEMTLNNMLSKDAYLFSFVVMTAPRRGDPPFLTQTLQSYLDQWPLLPSVPELPVDTITTTPSNVTSSTATTGRLLYDRIQLFVYTHFSDHLEYDRAYERFGQDPKGKQYIKWVHEQGYELNHRLHISSALQHATSNGPSTYVALLEDDFPICGRHAWREIEHVVYEANRKVPDHCGVFVGTGGSGLFLKSDIAILISRLLLEYTDIPPDIVIQKCLLGELPECRACSQTLVVSKTLLMHHIGFNASTSADRQYKKNEFQCGWRHPFNGDPNVITM